MQGEKLGLSQGNNSFWGQTPKGKGTLHSKLLIVLLVSIGLGSLEVFSMGNNSRCTSKLHTIGTLTLSEVKTHPLFSLLLFCV